MAQLKVLVEFEVLGYPGEPWVGAQDWIKELRYEYDVIVAVSPAFSTSIEVEKAVAWLDLHGFPGYIHLSNNFESHTAIYSRKSRELPEGATKRRPQ